MHPDMDNALQEIGKLRTLRRYPVKSMKGEELSEVFVHYSGLAGDRAFAFVDPANESDFPWVSARQIPEMILFEPRFVRTFPVDRRYPAREAFEIEVTTPEGQTRRLEDPAFLNELERRWGRPLVLRFSEKGNQDSRPLQLFSVDTLKLLGEEAAMAVDGRRFRANFYVEWASSKPLFEEELVGRTLQIGEKLRILIDKKDPRCVIVNLDPDTATSSPTVLKTVGKMHKGSIGVYAITRQEGVARAGDPIYLVDQ